MKLSKEKLRVLFLFMTDNDLEGFLRSLGGLLGAGGLGRLQEGRRARVNPRPALVAVAPRCGFLLLVGVVMYPASPSAASELHCLGVCLREVVDVEITRGSRETRPRRLPIRGSDQLGVEELNDTAHGGLEFLHQVLRGARCGVHRVDGLDRSEVTHDAADTLRLVVRSPRGGKYARPEQRACDAPPVVHCPLPNKYGASWTPRAITQEDISRGWSYVIKWGPKIADRVRKDYETVLMLSNRNSSTEAIVGILGQMLPLLSAGTCENYIPFITTTWHHTDNQRVLKACEAAHADADTTHAADISEENLWKKSLLGDGGLRTEDLGVDEGGNEFLTTAVMVTGRVSFRNW